ncbi:nicotinate-nucleotide adenylyltransferase [Carnobacteriaceae bacterium zg-ZUI240]|nr:nicotinate-nucleotide adenylyltransferase [Carnobacteriaceae bacterium zg-ZUI240]
MMQKTQQKIGILGGSFNPIHMAHLRNAQSVLDQLGLDKIIVLPSGTPPYKTTKKLVDTSHRLEMVRLAISDNPKFEVNTIEMDTPGVHYTFDTIQSLKQHYQNAKFYFIIGGDMIDALHTWYRIDELIQEVTFVGIDRMHSKNESSVPFIPLHLPLLDISSSMIRQMVQNQQSIRYLVPNAVMQYIEKERLYVDEYTTS